MTPGRCVRWYLRQRSVGTGELAARRSPMRRIVHPLTFTSLWYAARSWRITGSRDAVLPGEVDHHRPGIAPLRIVARSVEAPARSRSITSPTVRSRSPAPRLIEPARPGEAAAGDRVRSWSNVVWATAHPPLSSPMHPFGRDACLVEEHLAERVGTVHQLQRPDLDAGLIHVDQEVGDAAVLGLIAIGAGEQHPEVGLIRPGVPHLLARHDPLVAVTLALVHRHSPGRNPTPVR